MNQDNMGKKTYGEQRYVRDYKIARNENTKKRTERIEKTEKTVKKTHTLWPLLVLFALGGILLLLESLPYRETVANKLPDAAQKATSQVEKPSGTPASGIATEKLLSVAGRADVQEVTRLIQEGANVNAEYNYRWTPLMFAARYNSDPEILGALIENGANVNAVNIHGSTPLMAAAIYNSNPDVTRALLEHGASVNAVDNLGHTPLMQAARYNSSPEVLKLLIENGADVGIKDKNGQTALDHAAKNEKLRGTEAYILLQEKAHSPSPSPVKF